MINNVPINVALKKNGFKFAEKKDFSYFYLHPETDEVVVVTETFDGYKWTIFDADLNVTDSGDKGSMLGFSLRNRFKVEPKEEEVEPEGPKGICKSCGKERELDSNGFCFQC